MIGPQKYVRCSGCNLLLCWPQRIPAPEDTPSDVETITLGGLRCDYCPPSEPLEPHERRELEDKAAVIQELGVIAASRLIWGVRRVDTDAEYNLRLGHWDLVITLHMSWLGARLFWPDFVRERFHFLLRASTLADEVVLIGFTVLS